MDFLDAPRLEMATLGDQLGRKEHQVCLRLARAVTRNRLLFLPNHLRLSVLHLFGGQGVNA